MANAVQPEDMEAYRNITEVFGEFSFIANTIRSFYIKFMDVFGYHKQANYLVYKIIEIKAMDASQKDVYQLVKYVEWIAEFLCGNNLGRMKGFIIAKEFPADILKSFKEHAYRNIVFINYSVSNARLFFRIFTPESKLESSS